MEKSENKRRKILLIDDDDLPCDRFEDRLGKDSLDCPRVGAGDADEALVDVETCLREVPYRAILMDGQLYLKLGMSSDGEALSCRIREGVYGDTNEETPIYNISSAFPNRYATGKMSKDDSSYFEESVETLKEILEGE
jgi:hypothetical protein